MIAQSLSGNKGFAMRSPSQKTGDRKCLPTAIIRDHDRSDQSFVRRSKEREKGRVVKVTTRVVFGTLVAVLAALARSLVSTVVNTVFVERHNGSDRHRNGRKVRKTCAFSKDWEVHEAMTYFTMYSYNFCWPVRTLDIVRSDGSHLKRTPAMAAGLSDHVWSTKEWATYPARAP